MRIAIASGSFPRSADQAHTAPANFQLAKALANRGHHVLVLTFCQDDDPADQEGEVSVNGIRVVRKRANYERFRCFQGIPALSVFSWQAGRARDLFLWAKPLLASFNPHVLECPESYGLGFFWAAERTFPLVIRCHGPMSLLIRLGNVGIYSPADLELVEAMELSTIAAADGIMSVCDDLADRLSNATGRARCDFRVVRVPLAASEPPLKRKTRAQPSEFPRLLFWGRVERQKGADLLIEALPHIVRQFPGARLLIAGQETTESGQDRPLADFVRRRLAELNLSHRVEFLGFLSKEEIKQQVTAADLCVFPSRYETACYSVLEAQSYGACVVTTRVGGLKEYQSHRETAWLVEPDDPAALAAAIITLYRDEPLRRRLAEQGRQHTLALCDPDICVKRSIEVYNTAVARFSTSTSRADPAFRLFASRLGVALEDASPSEQMFRAFHEHLTAEYQRGYQDGASQHIARGIGSYVVGAARKVGRLVSP